MTAHDSGDAVGAVNQAAADPDGHVWEMMWMDMAAMEG
jgi:predicted lactoylglutathione lyase